MPGSPSDTSSPAVTEAPAIGVLDRLVGYHLRRASLVFAGDFARTLAGTGMRQVLFGILSVVAASPRINQGAIGKLLGIQRANMVALVNELVENGMVTRETASGDRRAFALTLTDAGRHRLATCMALVERHEEDLLHDLSVAERRQLIALLGRIEARER